MSLKKIIILGGSGSIGSSIAEEIKNNGYEPILIARNKNDLEIISKKLNCQYYECDVIETEKLNSIIESFDNQENNNIKRRNKTIKNQKKTENTQSIEKVNNIREKMGLDGFQSESVEPMNDDDNEGLANFEPPEKPLSAGTERMELRESLTKAQKENDDDDQPVSKEGFSEINGGYAQQYYDQYIPYYTNASSSNQVESGNFQNSEIMTKLNYLINLIEEEHDEKKNSVTEELVLYCFLGVFVIFIVDSFTKAGKYVR